MKVLAIEGREGWFRGAIVLLVALTGAVLVPGALFWTAVLGVGLMGVTLATVALVRSRRTPSLAQVITNTQSAIGRPGQEPRPLPDGPGGWMPATRNEIRRAVRALAGPPPPEAR